MLRIKLRRTGKKHQPSYRLVVVEKLSKPHAEGLENLGWVDPLQHTREIRAERIKYWISRGAQPTGTVHNILVSEGVIEGEKRPVHAKSNKKKEKKEGIKEKTAKAPEARTESEPTGEKTPEVEAKETTSDEPKTEKQEQAET